MKKLKDISVAELQQKYLDLIRPTNFIKTFKDDAEFTEWARQGICTIMSSSYIQIR